MTRFEKAMEFIKDLMRETQILRRALFLSCRWTIEGQPQSRESAEGAMGHFVKKANAELFPGEAKQIETPEQRVAKSMPHS